MAQKKRLVSQEERSEINRRNGKKGAGKHTPEGKRISSQNSRKHGMTGAGDALTREEQADLDAMLPHWNADLQPNGMAQHFFVRRIALLGCRLERSAIQENAVLALKAREATGAYDREVQNNVEQLGIRLLNDPVPRASGSDILPSRDHPIIRKWQVDEPIILVMELKETVEGCDYLLARWKELEFMLANEGYWYFDSKFKAIRMLGKRFETMLDDTLVGDIFANCHALLPEQQEKWVLFCQHAAYLVENRPLYHVRLAKLAERIPEDKQVALDFLHGIVDREIEALEARREELLPVHELNRAEAPLRSAFDDSKEGELRRRYETANERELHRCLADFMKLKKLGIGGGAAPVDEKESEEQSGSEDTTSGSGTEAALRNEAKWGMAAASDGSSMGPNVAPEGSNRGDSPPAMVV